MLKIIFMGTPAFALPALDALHGAGHEIVAVYSQPPRPAGRGMKLTASPVQQRAEQLGLPVFTPTSLKSPEEQQAFAALNADVAVVAAYGLLLPTAILNAPKRGCVNIHPSALPRWRGAAPIQRTIMAGDTETSVCIMQMDEGLDTGDILLEQRFTIPPQMDAGELHDNCAVLGATLLLKTLAQNPTARKQSAAGVTYANKITKEECEIDWKDSAQNILNKIRGLSPAPGAWTLLNSERLKIFKATIGEATAPYAFPCGDGQWIVALEIQKPGGKRHAV